jgi:hypothetical protein
MLLLLLLGPLLVPQVRGFAGPTYLPRRPHQQWPSAVHMSDVSFFWTAPVTWSKDGLVRSDTCSWQ